MKIITSLAVISILVEDQDEALRFYTEKLGLEKRSDVHFGPGMRWLTVAPKGQKRPEIALAKPDIRKDGIARAMPMATPSVTRLACRPLLCNTINITIAATRGKADRIISTGYTSSLA